MYTTYEDERIRLRPFNSEEEYLRIMERGLAAEGETWGPRPAQLNTLRQRFAADGGLPLPGCGTFAVELLDGGWLAGSVSYAAPQYGIVGGIGVFIERAYQGRRLAQAAVALCLCFLFENLPLTKVEAITSSLNLAAQRSLAHAGATCEGRLTGVWFAQGGWQSNLYYAIFREEWEAQDYRHAVKRGL